MRFVICLALAWMGSAGAINRMVLEADSLQVAGMQLEGARATLALQAQGRSALRTEVTRLQISQPVLGLHDLQLDCGETTLQELLLACRKGRLVAKELPALLLGAEWRPQHWQFSAAAGDTTLATFAALLQPWWTMPPTYSVKGNASFNATAQGRGSRLEQGTLEAGISALDLQNQAGTVVTEKVRATLSATLRGSMDDLVVSASLQGQSGQALAGPVLADFGAQPLTLTAEARLTEAGIELSQVQLAQPGVLSASGRATLLLKPTPVIASAVLDVDALQFPGAYTSLLQLALADSNFGALDSSGTASGHVELRANRLVAIDAQLHDLNFTDAARHLELAGLAGSVHWHAASAPAPQESQLGWQQLRAFGVEGGASAVQLLVHGAALRLVQPARIAIFDGALAVQRFDAAGLGGSDVVLGFDASVEPISMQKLSVAFGWPEMSGQLSGRLPGLELRNGTLSVAGDITASVFDGRIVASRLQLRDALGRFPRLSGDFRARGLDLDRITRTFPIGSITGHLDADILALELFDWSPIAFDGHLYTTPGDRTRHRISQKAVGSLANIGGGGGGVTAALQSGLLRFFDDFGYDRIGLSCQLRDDVCLMDGIARNGGGFYIVKGGGLPRIDVIGNAGRVAWAQLVSQVSAAIASQNVIVR